MATSKKDIVVTLRLKDKGAVQQLGALDTEAKQLSASLKLLRSVVEENGKANKNQEKQIGTLVAKLENNRVKYRELKNELSGATAAGLRFRDVMADAARSGLGAFGLNILTVAGGVTALVTAFKSGVQTLADFDAALSKVSALGGEYAENIGQIAEVTKEVGIQFGFTAVQSVEAVEALAKAGVSVQDILGGGLEGALTLAAAGTLDVATAAEAAAKAMVQFGLAGEDVTHIADLFANSANKALGEVSDITAALNQSGQVANQFGVSIEETVGTLTAFAQAGLLGSDAGTSFRTMLIRLAKPTDDSAKLMEQLGINAFDAQGAFVGIENLAGQLQSQLKGLTEEQRNSALATIFGTDAIRSASILYEGGADSIAKWTTEVSESGEAARIAQEKTNNLRGDVDKLSASYDALILGESGITSFFRAFVQGTTDAINGLNGLYEHPWFQRADEYFDLVNAEREKVGISPIAGLSDEVASDLNKSFSLIESAIKRYGDDADQMAAIQKKLRQEVKDAASTGLVSFAQQEDFALAKARLEFFEANLKKQTELNAKTAAADLAAAAAKKEVGVEVVDLTTKVEKLTAAQKKAAEQAKELAAAEDLVTGGKDVLNKPQQDEAASIVPLDNQPALDAAKSAALEYQAIQEQLRIQEIQGIVDFNTQLAALDAEYYADKTISLEEYEARKKVILDNSKEAELDNQRKQVQAAADFFGALSELAQQGTSEFKALATTQALINTYLGATQVLTDVTLPTFAKILGVAAVIASGLASVAKIQGFAKGGRVEANGRVTQEWGPRVNRDNGDTVLATLKPNEAVLNEDQQDRAKQLYGSDFFRRIGVPGFAIGGRTTRGSALVNLPTVSPRDITNIEAAAEQRAIEFSPVVSVVEMNRVQNRVRVIQNLSTA